MPAAAETRAPADDNFVFPTPSAPSAADELFFEAEAGGDLATSQPLDLDLDLNYAAYAVLDDSQPSFEIQELARAVTPTPPFVSVRKWTIAEDEEIEAEVTMVLTSLLELLDVDGAAVFFGTPQVSLRAFDSALTLSEATFFEEFREDTSEARILLHNMVDEVVDRNTLWPFDLARLNQALVADTKVSAIEVVR
jgi:hypothetical protein